MSKKLTLDDFIRRAREVHGDKYDYSLISEDNYASSICVIPIVCAKHGLFLQPAYKHLIGHNCPSCSIEKKRKNQIYGVATDDFNASLISKESLKAKDIWANMLLRCYDNNFHKKYPTYKDCNVCDEWLRFSNFKRWFDENYVEGYQLDKDILVKDNKVYSPNTCCFVPQKINSLFIKTTNNNGKRTIGIIDRKNGTWGAYITKDTKRYWLGTFKNKDDAMHAYKEAKESYIHEVACEYYGKGEINLRVYQSLMNYKI